MFLLRLVALTFLLAASTGISEERKATAEQRYAAAAAYLQSKNGHAMLVYEDGKLVYEKYLNGYKPDQPHRLASGTKSFSGAMAVAAAMDGLLSFDEPVSKTLLEWKEDERLSKITIRQLLQLNSGIEPGDNGAVPSYEDAIRVRAIDEAGNKFRYGPNAFMVFGELMRRKLDGKHESPLAYLEDRIFKPIGLRHGPWRKDDAGNPHMPSGAFITAREWAKFGLLIQNQGRWNGATILDETLLKECFSPAKANPSYGITFWLGRGQGLPEDLVMAAGAGKQKLYIVPSMDLLVVQLAEAKRYQESVFMKHILDGHAGKISDVEIKEVATDPVGAPPRRGMNRTGDRLEEMFREMDKDNDGKINREEGSRMRRFDELDTNEDGFISLDEVMRLFQSPQPLRPAR